MSIAITGVRLIDGTGAAPLEEAVVVIEKNRIVAVGPKDKVQLPEGVTLWDLAGYTLLPGLIDVHEHVTADPTPGKPLFGQSGASPSLAALQVAHFARQNLEAGFTTIRDVGAPNRLIFALRQAIAEGAVPGPRIIASGNVITSTAGHGTEYTSMGYIEADSADELRRAVREQVKAGVDFIKFITSDTGAPAGRRYYTVEQLRFAVVEAHATGHRVAAHANASADGVRRAVDAGVDTIEHGYPADSATLEKMAAQGTILVPTLAVVYQLLNVDAKDSPFTPAAHARMQQIYEQTLDTTRRAYKIGTKIALGTDAGSPATWHGDGVLEMILLVEAGLSPLEAIVAGTKIAAEACGRADQLGTIEAGKLADLLIVTGDPLKDIACLRDPANIKLVMQDGKVAITRALPHLAEA